MNKPVPLYLMAGLSVAQSQGAAVIISFVMDLFTVSRADGFTPGEVVNILDMIGQRELPPGLLNKVKDYAGGQL